MSSSVICQSCPRLLHLISSNFLIHIYQAWKLWLWHALFVLKLYINIQWHFENISQRSDYFVIYVCTYRYKLCRIKASLCCKNISEEAMRYIVSLSVYSSFSLGYIEFLYLFFRSHNILPSPKCLDLIFLFEVETEPGVSDGESVFTLY